MKNTTLGQLKDEARELGCELLFGGRIRLVTYNAEGLYNVTKYFDYKDETCESKIRAELKEIKNQIIDDFYSMAGSIQQLSLSMKYDHGKVIIFREYSANATEIVAEFSCNPTGLREMTSWVADMLLQCLEDKANAPTQHKMLAKSKARMVTPITAGPRPEEILVPQYFIVSLQRVQQVDPEAAEKLLTQYIVANDKKESSNC